MLKKIKPEDCSGCSACATICPKGAIIMEPDSLGFLYPRVNQSQCINCGLCEKVCSFNQNYDKSANIQYPLAFGARHKNLDEVKSSRSGAVFIALSDYILDKGGVIYGAGYMDGFTVAHKRAETKKERNEFKGSKYVQSDLNGVFRQVKKDLKEERLVLFSGTPCQTAALKSIVESNLRKNLFLVDVVCHGVASPYIWRDYLAYLEDKVGDKISYVNFRDKSIFGWCDHRETFEFQKEPGVRKAYPCGIYMTINFRKSCGKCYYTNTCRPSDVTIADFWGWEKINPNFVKDDNGVSLVLCNSIKGKQLFDMVKEYLDIFSVSIDVCIQESMKFPTKLDSRRDEFEMEYMRKGFDYVYNKYGVIGWRYRLKTIRDKFINKMKKHLACQ